MQAPRPPQTPVHDDNCASEDGDEDERAATASVDEDDDDDEEDEEEDEEPRLKYTRLTKSLGSVYRNGDAVSTTLVFGERMIIGTHNGNIHILSLPSLTSLRTYKAHSATISSIDISPPPPPPAALQTKRQREASHDRHISIATSSIDGLVCVVPLLPSTPPAPGQSLANVPYKKAEIMVKNFKRPILAVALSPNFRADRMFLSGGLAGNLVLSTATVGNGGWMTLGLGSAKDTILHSGEGTISAIAWSKESPRYVAWTNEQGIKIMRSHIIPPTIHNQSAEDVAGNPGLSGWIPGLGSGGRPAGEVAWKRISAIERPESIPEELAALHKPRLEWIDRRTLMTTEPGEDAGGSLNVDKIDWSDKEKLVVGWGRTVWVMDVFDRAEGDDNSFGWAQITHIFETDCIISGIHMYTPSLLLVLAYISAPPEESLQPVGSTGSSKSAEGSPARTFRTRNHAAEPELRFIDLTTSEEISADELMMSRFEGLSVGDYHLSILPATPAIVQPPSEESGGIGAGIWAAAINPAQLFSGAASVRSFGSGSRRDSVAGTSTSARGLKDKPAKAEPLWGEDERGTKIYIVSPYDVVFATERSPRDHLHWMLERDQYQEAWHLIDRHPEVVDSDAASSDMYDEEERKVVEEGYESDSASSRQHSVKRYSAVEREKRRIGELWLQKLIKANEWKKAGEVCGKVLGTSTRWEHWVWVFEAARKIREITPYIPTKQLSPPLPTVIYEIVLAHYLHHDKKKFKKLLLETWKPDGSRTLYDARTITDAITRTLDNREGELKPGDEDWVMLQECLAKLYMVLQEPKNALRRYIILKDADEAFRLIKEYRLVDAVSEDVSSIVLLRLTDEQIKSAPVEELEESATEAMDLLVEEADKGILSPQTVVDELDNPEVPLGKVFLFFYLRRLWNSDHNETKSLATGVGAGGILVGFGDLMVELFAEYDRPLLMRFLKESHSYSLEKASTVCERRNYVPELVHLLSKTGQTKRALFLIIDKLADVSQAIDFAKTQDDPDLWKDLLDYSMDKPAFIRGLLENVGTAIDPITLVRRIPAGLEIEGLKQALAKILKEYGVQWSICDGVAKALRSEVGRGMDRLRSGRRKGVRVNIADSTLAMPGAFGEEARDLGHGTCGVCQKLFFGHERYTIVAFACTHVFHLHCLSPSDEEQGTDDGDYELGGAYGHSVGAKVTHAALIRDKIAEGCSVCRERKRAEVMV